MLPSSTWKFTSLPIRLNDTGLRNFHSRFKYISTSLLKVASFAFRFFQPVPAVKAAVMHPRAPAGLKSRYLLPITESVPQRTIVVKRRPLEYFCPQWKTRWGDLHGCGSDGVGSCWAGATNWILINLKWISEVQLRPSLRLHQLPTQSSLREQKKNCENA